MPRSFLALAAVALFSLAACQSDGAPNPHGPGPHPPPGPPPTAGKMCGGIAGFRCDQGQYCKIEAPMYPDKSGVCVARPDVCPMIYRPVCGMDGKTYSNACLAGHDGASVAHDGACAATP